MTSYFTYHRVTACRVGALIKNILFYCPKWDKICTGGGIKLYNIIVKIRIRQPIILSVAYSKCGLLDRTTLLLFSKKDSYKVPKMTVAG